MIRLPSFIEPGKHLFYAGFLISFLGSLPPGMTNIITVRIAINGDYIRASWFALGALAAEVICAKICSAVMSRMSRFRLIVSMLQWLVLLILTAMAVMSFVASVKEPAHGAGDLIRSDVSPFIFGFLLMAINPVQIPFWLGWATILLEKKMLISHQLGQVRYLLGIAIGSLLASAIFIAGGRFLFSLLMVEERSMHFIFGCVFAIMAVTHARKLLRVNRKDVEV